MGKSIKGTNGLTENWMAWSIHSLCASASASAVEHVEVRNAVNVSNATVRPADHSSHLVHPIQP